MTFANNKLNGKYIEYYNNGDVKLKGSYTNGKPSGIWAIYDMRGLQKQGSYEDVRENHYLKSRDYFLLHNSINEMKNHPISKSAK